MMEEENNHKKEHTRTCPYCKQPYQIKTGLNNWKNLFRKPTMDDWITLIILSLLILASYAYTEDTKQCRRTLNDIGNYCINYVRTMSNLSYDETSVDKYKLIIPSNITNTSNQNLGGETYSDNAST